MKLMDFSSPFAPVIVDGKKLETSSETCLTRIPRLFPGRQRTSGLRVDRCILENEIIYPQTLDVLQQWAREIPMS